MKIRLNDELVIKVKTISKWESRPYPYFSDYFKPWMRIWNYRLECEVNGHTFRFTWHDSISAWAEGERTMTERKYINAFSNALSDAISYLQCPTLEDFINEFGYDTEDYCAEKVYEACGVMYNEFAQIFSEQEMYDLSNELEERW